jgi:hypothetical protein
MAACNLTQTNLDVHGTGNARRAALCRACAGAAPAAGAAQSAAMAVIIPSAMRVRYQLIAWPLSI